MLENTITYNSYISAAYWALHEPRETTHINIKKQDINEQYCLILFNNSKSLLYNGFQHPQQELLKGLIVKYDKIHHEIDSIVAPCLPKFYNAHENGVDKTIQEFINKGNAFCYFPKKYDGVNIRSYYNEATHQTEFATRGTITGCESEESDLNTTSYTNFGYLARKIAEEKYPILLNPEFSKKFICVFELIHPEAKILTNYDGLEDLILLNVYEIENERVFQFNIKSLKIFSIIHNLNMMDFWSYKELSPLNDYEYQLQQISEQGNWKNTLEEGTVVICTDINSNILYRFKYKNKKYLETLNIVKNCSLKITKKICDDNNVQNWEQLREILYREYQINEEIEYQYANFYLSYVALQNNIKVFKEQLIENFYTFTQFNPTQKEFAEIIKDQPYKSLLFALKKHCTDIENFWSREETKKMIDKIFPIEEF